MYRSDEKVNHFVVPFRRCVARRRRHRSCQDAVYVTRIVASYRIAHLRFDKINGGHQPTFMSFSCPITPSFQKTSSDILFPKNSDYMKYCKNCENQSKIILFSLQNLPSNVFISEFYSFNIEGDISK